MPSAPAPSLPLAPLDLSLPSDIAEDFPAAGEALPSLEEPKPLLPPLFEAKANEPGSFELGGSLITNEQADDEDAWHSVEGAELQLHFRR